MRTQADIEYDEGIVKDHEAKLRKIEVDILETKLLANKTEAEYWKVKLEVILETPRKDNS